MIHSPIIKTLGIS